MPKNKSISTLELPNDLSVQFVQFDAPEEMSEFILEKFIQPVNYTDFIISGGKSILPFYNSLNIRPQIIRNKNFYLSDERMAGAESNSSNQYNLLTHYAELGKRTSGFNDTDYKEKIIGLLQKKYISILGIGEDGHIASLFPEDLYYKNDELIHNFKKANESFTRASLGFNIFVKSSELIFWIFGASKRVLLDMLKKKDQTRPFVKLILEYNKLQLKPIVVCDKDFLPNA